MGAVLHIFECDTTPAVRVENDKIVVEASRETDDRSATVTLRTGAETAALILRVITDRLSGGPDADAEVCQRSSNQQIFYSRVAVPPAEFMSMAGDHEVMVAYDVYLGGEPYLLSEHQMRRLSLDISRALLDLAGVPRLPDENWRGAHATPQ